MSDFWKDYEPKPSKTAPVQENTMIYKTFEQWKNGNVLEHGVPRTEYYSEDQLDLVEMGWNYGYDAGRAVEQALDKKAENARELGLDYEPVCNKDPQGCWNVRCQLGKKCKNTPAQQEPVQDNPLDCGVHLGSGKDHAIKHHVSYGPAQPVPDAFEQLMREADKPTQVPEGIAKCVNALMDGMHEITSVTIRPKRTWVSLTDDEVFDVWLNEMPAPDKVFYQKLCRSIEAKLKEMNT
jgi:hypothetical protein